MSGKKRSQREEVLEVLRAHFGRWYPGRLFLSHWSEEYPKSIVAYAQRVSELNERGFFIDSRKESGHPTYEYKLVSEPGQREMAV